VEIVGFEDRQQSECFVKHDELLDWQTKGEKQVHTEIKIVHQWIFNVKAWPYLWTKLSKNGIAWNIFSGTLRHGWIMPTTFAPGRVWFLFDKSYDPRAPSARPVVVHDPLIVVEVLCDLSLSSRAKLIRFCVQNGIEHSSPCRCVDQPSEHQLLRMNRAKAVRSSEQNYGVRPVEHEFIAANFIQYLNTITDWMKQSPRIALLAARRGGLYWRLVNWCGPDVFPELDSFDEVSELAACGLGHTYVCGEFQFCSNSMSLEEETKFIGTFECTDGVPGNLNAMISFFPRHKTWTGSSLNIGSWSPGAEDWFSRRTEKMLSARAGEMPRLQTGAKWRNNLRGSDVSKLVVNQCRRRAEAFLQSRFDEDLLVHVSPNLRGCELSSAVCISSILTCVIQR
jgi:hypothetical protein